MKALVLKKYNELIYEDVPEPKIEPEEVLLRIKACAVCGSDVHGMDGSTGRRIPPVIMGHEASGVVETVGEKVTGFTKGDRVTFDSTIYCGKCRFCRSGRINLCDNRKVLGVSCNDYRQNGAFAEYLALPQHIVKLLPEKVTFEEAALVEPVAVALHAVNRTPVTLNDSAVVVGAGTIGLLVIQLLRLGGCRRIIAVDTLQQRLELARKLGATDGVAAAADDLPGQINKLAGGQGVDLAFDAVGITTALQTAVASLRKGGHLTLIGNLSSQAEFPLQSVVTKELSVNGSCASAGEYDAGLDLLARGALDVRPLISAVQPLAEGAGWFQRLYRKEPGLIKVILTP